jgi:hypothetical protein
MKKVILVLATVLTLLSCEKEKLNDCGCDRVNNVTMGGYKVVYGGYMSDVYQTYKVQTVNDCSKFNQTKEFIEYEGSKIPQIGECYNK